MPLSAVERSQCARLALALGAWKEGRADNALLILGEVQKELMTPRVGARVAVAEAGYRAELNDFAGSEDALRRAAIVIDHADVETRGSFHIQRGRVHRKRGRLDDAITDYTGAAICWELARNPEKQGAAYLNLADLHLELTQVESADENLCKAFVLLERTHSFYLPQAYETRARLLLAQERPGSALDAITIALSSVGDNENWRREFLQTKRLIKSRILDVLEVKRLEDCDRLKVLVTEKALREANGSLSGAGRIIGATHHAVTYIVDQNKELEPYRKKRRVRRRSLIKH